MNELMNIKLGKNKTISSMDLVTIINEFRKAECEDYTELQHKSFLTKIRKELETLKFLGLKGEQNISPSSYINSQNKEQPCYLLNRDGMLQMLNSESTFVRYKTIEYINKLEKEVVQAPKKLSAIEQLKLQQEALIEINEKVDNLEGNMPLFKAECDELQDLVHKVGVRYLGGKKSKAYNDASLRGRVYADIQHQLKREFGVNKYAWIKHSQFNKAKEIISNYTLPIVLEDEITLINNQLEMEEI